MLFGSQSESKSQQDAELDLFLQQIIEQEDLSGNIWEADASCLPSDEWNCQPPQNLLPTSITDSTLSAAPAGVPQLSPVSGSQPAALTSAFTQLQPANAQHLTGTSNSNAAQPTILQLTALPPATRPYSQTAAASNAQAEASLSAVLAYSQASPIDLYQAAIHQQQQLANQLQTHQQAMLQYPVAPGAISLHSPAVTTAVGAATKRSQAWTEKNRRAQQRFRERQRVCANYLTG